jgi:hypothetical protein
MMATMPRPKAAKTLASLPKYGDGGAMRPQMLADGGPVVSPYSLRGMANSISGMASAIAKPFSTPAGYTPAMASAPAPAPAPSATSTLSNITSYGGTGALQRREAAAGLKNGGIVKGPGTGTSDSVPSSVPVGSFIMPADSTKSIGAAKLADLGNTAKVPVRLSAGEMKIPPAQVHAVGVKALMAMKDATHTPADNFGAMSAMPGKANGGPVDDDQQQQAITPIAGATQASLAGAGRGTAPDPRALGAVPSIAAQTLANTGAPAPAPAAPVPTPAIPSASGSAAVSQIPTDGYPNVPSDGIDQGTEFSRNVNNSLNALGGMGVVTTVPTRAYSAAKVLSSVPAIENAAGPGAALAARTASNLPAVADAAAPAASGAQYALAKIPEMVPAENVAQRALPAPGGALQTAGRAVDAATGVEDAAPTITATVKSPSTTTTFPAGGATGSFSSGADALASGANNIAARTLSTLPGTNAVLQDGAQANALAAATRSVAGASAAATGADGATAAPSPNPAQVAPGNVAAAETPASAAPGFELPPAVQTDPAAAALPSAAANRDGVPKLGGQAGQPLDGAPGVSKFKTADGRTLYSNVAGTTDNDKLMSDNPGLQIVPAAGGSSGGAAGALAGGYDSALSAARAAAADRGDFAGIKASYTAQGQNFNDGAPAPQSAAQLLRGQIEGQLAAGKRLTPQGAQLLGAGETTDISNAQANQRLQAAQTLQGATAKLADLQTGGTQQQIAAQEDLVASLQGRAPQPKYTVVPQGSGIDANGFPVKYPSVVLNRTGQPVSTGAPPAAAAAPTGASLGLTGENYLATLPSDTAAKVRMLADGKLPLSAMSLRSPMMASLLTHAAQYDPGTDATTYLSRAATAKDAATGKLATSNNALNTVAGHLGALAESAAALHNTSFPWINGLKNAVQSSTGDPRVKTFNLNLQGVADELERAYRGAGGSEGSIKQWRENLGTSNSPDQFQAVMKKGAEMLQSKLQANQEQYAQGMKGRVGSYRSITPEAEKALAKLRGEAPPAAAAPATIPAAAPIAAAAPAPAVRQAADPAHVAELQKRAQSDPVLAARLKQMGY